MLRSLIVQLPPSVNALHINRRGSYKRILSEKGRDYIYVYSLEIAQWLRKIEHEPFDDYFYLDVEWWLPRSNCDSHNYEKGLLDCMENAGLMTNDKYAMVRTQAVQFDTKEPRAMLTWEENNQ